jgi:hyperosmotically inducible protein
VRVELGRRERPGTSAFSAIPAQPLRAQLRLPARAGKLRRWTMRTRRRIQFTPRSIGLALVAMVGGCAGTTHTTRDDVAVNSRVAQRLDQNAEMRRYEIDPDAEDGIVTLRGEVDDRTQRTSAEQIARETPGVIEVENMVMVRDDDARDAVERAVDDAMLETTVRARLVGDPILRPFRIYVDTHDGTVVLDGIVRDNETRERAQDLTETIDGVERVENRLRISGPSLKTIP